MTDDLDDIRGAVARGWTRPVNASREMDPDLAEAISQEVAAEITRLRAEVAVYDAKQGEAGK